MTASFKTVLFVIATMCAIVSLPTKANAQTNHEDPALWIRTGAFPTLAEALAPGVIHDTDASPPAIDVDGDGVMDALLKVHREEWPGDPDSLDVTEGVMIAFHRPTGWTATIVLLGRGEAAPGWGAHGVLRGGDRTVFWYQLTNSPLGDSYRLTWVHDGTISLVWAGLPPRGDTIVFTPMTDGGILLTCQTRRGRPVLYNTFTWWNTGLIAHGWTERRPTVSTEYITTAR